MKKEKLEKYKVEFNELSEQIKKDPTNEALVENFKEELFDLNSDYIEGITDSLKEDYNNFKLLVDIIIDKRCQSLSNFKNIADIRTVLWELEDEKVIDFIKQFEGNYDVLSTNYGLSNYLTEEPDLLADYLDYSESFNLEATCVVDNDGDFSDVLEGIEFKNNLRERIDVFVNANRDSLNEFVKQIYKLSDPCHYAMTPNAIDKISFHQDDLEEILISALNDQFEDTKLAQHIIDEHLLNDIHIEHLTNNIWYHLNHEGEAKFVRVIEDLNINLLEEDFDYEETREQLLRLSGFHRTKENVNGF